MRKLYIQTEFVMARKKPRPEAVPPTPEQQARGRYELGDVIDRDGARAIRVGKAYRLVRMVETLHRRDLLSDDEAKALCHYRHHADTADRSLVRDSLCVQRQGGSRDGITVTMLDAIRVTRDCEAAAGSLRGILRAVVVDDHSLSQWAISQAGAIEDCRTASGVRICRLRPRLKALRRAEIEIRMAAQRVRAELDA